jgi:hypothetical protein
MAFSRSFLEVVALLGVAFDEYQASTGLRTVLVGGAAFHCTLKGVMCLAILTSSLEQMKHSIWR